MQTRSIKSSLRWTLAATMLALSGQALADVVDCTPTRVRSMTDRMDTRCVGINRWFVAMRANTNPEHFNQMIALLNSAIVAGKPVKLYFTPATSDPTSNGRLFAVELFR